MIIKNDQKYIIRLVNLQTGKFAERAVSDVTLIVLRHIELRGVIQILDVRGKVNDEVLRREE